MSNVFSSSKENRCVFKVKKSQQEARNELIALNGIPIDWCVAEDKKRHVVAKAPGALCLACSECTRNHWKEASKFITEESKQYDI